MLNLLGIFAAMTLLILAMTVPTVRAEKRVVAMVGIPAVFACMWIVFFTGAWIAQQAILTAVYGFNTAWGGHITVTPTRDAILISNGDEFRGFQQWVCLFIVVLMVAAVGFLFRKLGQFLVLRFAPLKWLVDGMKDLHEKR